MIMEYYKEVIMNRQSYRYVISTKEDSRGIYPPALKLSGIKGSEGYILIVTLLMLVALVVAGMGAMMVATTDIQLSGNQRTQLAAKEASIMGINTGMATLCSKSFLTASIYAGNSVNGSVISTPPSTPQTGFYNGLYNTPIPTSSAGSSYAASFFTPTGATFGKSIPQPLGAYGSGSAVNIAPGLGGGGMGSIYRIGPIIGVVGNTKMECEQFVYYGLP